MEADEGSLRAVAIIREEIAWLDDWDEEEDGPRPSEEAVRLSRALLSRCAMTIADHQYWVHDKYYPTDEEWESGDVAYIAMPDVEIVKMADTCFKYEYRFVSAHGLERIDRKPPPVSLNNMNHLVHGSTIPVPTWQRVEGKDFLSMTWEELEHVAHVIRDASKPTNGALE